MDVEARERFFNARRGWSFGRRLKALDSYGLLLALILLSLIVSALAPSDLHAYMPVVRAVILGGTLVFALHTSGAKRVAYVTCGVLILIAIVSTLIVDPGTKQGDIVDALAGILLVGAMLIVILRRFLAHPVVTGQSVLAAVCVYVLFGLGYAGIYGLIGGIDPTALFANGIGDGTNVERIYYSFITLCTVGYGDFVPYGDVTRMVAVTEALVGQVYLVTIVALLVSHVGSERPHRGRDEG
jgi:hypothetical protein